eukprot:20889-Chlamydomonas_euryale.AAC.2
MLGRRAGRGRQRGAASARGHALERAFRRAGSALRRPAGCGLTNAVAYKNERCLLGSVSCSVTGSSSDSCNDSSDTNDVGASTVCVGTAGGVPNIARRARFRSTSEREKTRKAYEAPPVEYGILRLVRQ